MTSERSLRREKSIVRPQGSRPPFSECLGAMCGRPRAQQWLRPIARSNVRWLRPLLLCASASALTKPAERIRSDYGHDHGESDDHSYREGIRIQGHMPETDGRDR